MNAGLSKDCSELKRMREVCHIAALVLEKLADYVVLGISTYELDQIAKVLIEENRAQSACYNYQVGNRCFPAYTCISINEEVVHGIGRPDKIIQLGDVVTIDVCVQYNGYIGDNARTFAVEPVSDRIDYLIRSTEKALYIAIEQAYPGNRVGDISHAIEKYITTKNLSIVKEFAGHGVGKSMHEEPQIPNYGKPNTGKMLKPGMTLAIEPMVNLGMPQIEIADDGWTALTKDRQASAHFEHTVLVSSDGPEILTFIDK